MQGGRKELFGLFKRNLLLALGAKGRKAQRKMRAQALLIALFWAKPALPLPARSVQMVPPTRINRPEIGRGGGETGYRQIEKSELGKVVEQWSRQMGVVSGSRSIEAFEMLRLLDECSKAMPGSKPQRRELIAFAEIEDGSILTVALGYCTKVKCPWELDVLAILSLPRLDEVRLDNMANFLIDLCRENAIWPDFSRLDKYSSLFHDKAWVQRSFEQKRIFSGVVVTDDSLCPEMLGASITPSLLETVKATYKKENAAPSVVLDEHDMDALPSFWFRQSLRDPVVGILPLYFRQKRRAGEAVVDEFEVRFDPPVTGVSSGMPTVGCHLIIDCDNDQQVRETLGTDTQCRTNLLLVAKYIASKIKTPAPGSADLDGAGTAVAQSIPGASLEQTAHGRDEM